MTRLRIPLAQPIIMSFGTVRQQDVILVRLRDADGAEGVGEASVLGGPYWNEESADSIQAVIETYLAPLIVGQHFSGLEMLAATLTAVRGNASARNAVEMAALDLFGKKLGVPASTLFGGLCRDRIPLAWTLSTGSLEGDIREGERALAERGHRRFKVKVGKEAPGADLDRVSSILAAFQGRATVIADANQGWDELTAHRVLPLLEQAGLEAIEQPLRRGDVKGARRLRERLGIALIADEALTSVEAAFDLAARDAASAFALKPGRDGGLTASRRIASVAQAAGLDVYGGSMLETSLGTAASLHLYGSLPQLKYGCELFGPLRLSEDIAAAPIKVCDGTLTVPTGPGLGIALDEHKIAYLSREPA